LRNRSVFLTRAANDRDDASSIENLLSAGADRDFFFSSDERNQRRFFFLARANEREREKFVLEDEF
jgi:hypothetical protein